MAAFPYFSLDVVNFEDVAGAVSAHHVALVVSDIFDGFTWGDTSYALITVPEAVEALESYKGSRDKGKDDHIIDGITAIVEALEAIPKLTLVNLGGDEKHEYEQAKSRLFATSVDGKIVVKK
jgi:hypothetical protein